MFFFFSYYWYLKAIYIFWMQMFGEVWDLQWLSLRLLLFILLMSLQNRSFWFCWYRSLKYILCPCCLFTFCINYQERSIKVSNRHCGYFCFSFQYKLILLYIFWSSIFRWRHILNCCVLWMDWPVHHFLILSIFLALKSLLIDINTDILTTFWLAFA